MQPDRPTFSSDHPVPGGPHRFDPRRLKLRPPGATRRAVGLILVMVAVIGFLLDGLGTRTAKAQFQFPSSTIGERRPIKRPPEPKNAAHNLADRNQPSNGPATTPTAPVASQTPAASTTRVAPTTPTTQMAPSSPTTQATPSVEKSDAKAVGKSGEISGDKLDSPPAPALPSSLMFSVGSDGSLAQLIRSLALANVPKRYVNDKQWGQQKWVWRGVKVSLDGLRVDSEPRWKLVNHGGWKKYEIELSDRPDALTLDIKNMRQSPSDGRLQFDVVCLADLDLTGRYAQWERGVQLMSVGTAADAKLRLDASCDVAVQIDPLKLPPDVILKPQVTAARIELVDFHLRKLGDFDGPVVRELGRSLRDMLEDRIADESPKLAAKLNRQIEKQQDKLRLSALKREKQSP